MSKPKILYIAQEINPYLSKTPLSILGVDLPRTIQENGYEVRTFMPKYGIINERRNQLHEVIRLSGLNISIDDTDHPLIIKVATLQPSRMQVYFIDNDDYFIHHAAKELETKCSPEDNDERAIFFARGVIETVKKLRWEPAVIHVIGWVGAFAPLYIKEFFSQDPTFKSSKIVYSLFDEKFDGALDQRIAEKLRMDGFSDSQISHLINDADHIALNKLAIDFSDAIVESSGNIPQELIDYAIQSGKPFLRNPGEDYKEAYLKFYESLNQ